MHSAKYPRWFLFYGVLTILIGLIHNTATLAMYHRVATISPPALAVRYGYFFAAMGTAVILCGILLLLVVRGLRQGESLARRVAWCSLAYLLNSQVGAAACGLYNPYSIALILGAVVSCIVLVL